MSNYKRKENFSKRDVRFENLGDRLKTERDPDETREIKRMKSNGGQRNSYPSEKNNNNSPNSRDTKNRKNPEEDKKLQELVAYYEKILQTLKGLPKEDTGNSVKNKILIIYGSV